MNFRYHVFWKDKAPTFIVSCVPIAKGDVIEHPDGHVAYEVEQVRHNSSDADGFHRPSIHARRV